MKRLYFNLIFFIIILPLYLFWYLFGISESVTLWFLILIIFSIFRFKNMGISWWYSMALFIPLYNFYLIYKLIFVWNDKVINKPKNQENNIDEYTNKIIEVTENKDLINDKVLNEHKEKYINEDNRSAKIDNLLTNDKIEDKKDSKELNNEGIGEKEQTIYFIIILIIIVVLIFSLVINQTSNYSEIKNYKSNTLESDNEELLNDIDNIINDILDETKQQQCEFNWKRYDKPLDATCTNWTDKYNAWLCNEWFYEAWWDWEAKWQQVCVNKVTNMYNYYIK